MTLAEVRARLRAELGDETVGAYVWTDALLDAFVGDAVERLGQDAPAQRTTTVAPSGDGSYALPTDFLRLRSVALDGATLRAEEYTLWAGKLTLMAPTSASVAIRYEAARSRPPTTGDVGLGAGEAPPTVWLAASYAMGWLAKQREKAGLGLGHGANAVSGAYAARYEAWVSRRRPLRRVGVG